MPLPDLFKKTKRPVADSLKIRSPQVSKTKKRGVFIRPPIIYRVEEVEGATNFSKTTISSDSTNELTSNVIKALEVLGFFAYRISNEGRARENKKTGKPYRLDSLLPYGFPDILATQKESAKTIHIEIKSATDKISEWQLYFIKTRQDNGIPAFVVYSWQDFKIKMEHFLKIKIK